MLKTSLIEIRDAILQYNTYFNKGFADAFKDEKGVHEGEKVVFPNDREGDYFYMRYPNNYKVSSPAYARLNECTIATAFTTTVFLIASVKNAYADKLISNLVSVIISKGGKVTEAIGQKEVVIRQELSGMEQEVIKKGLANSGKNNTIVCVKFELEKPFYPTQLNCLENPCKC